jgi:hypothetical protein
MKKSKKDDLRYFDLIVTHSTVRKYQVLGRDYEEAMNSYNNYRTNTVPEKKFLGELSKTIKFDFIDKERLT